jgi:chromosome segregation ATPase
LQVDVEHVRGEIIERREQVAAMEARMQGYIDSVETAEVQVRQAIQWRQHETDRAEEYERDIQSLVVSFNHMQEEIALNEELKASVAVLSGALSGKREKKRFWKGKTTELRRQLSGIQREAEIWTQERDNEKLKHGAEVDALVEDIKRVRAYLHPSRARPLFLRPRRRPCGRFRYRRRVSAQE